MSLQHKVLKNDRLQAVYVIQPNGSITRLSHQLCGTQHTLSWTLHLVTHFG